MRDVAALLDGLCAERRVPSASLTVRVDGREVFHHTAGVARYAPERRAAEDQPYDLASVTKALVGSVVAAWAIERRHVGIDGQVARHLPDVDPRVTVRHLLLHASGYPAWRPLYETVHDAWGVESTRAAVLRAARATPLEAAPGERHIYSDLGFLVLLEVLEAVTGRPIDVLFSRLLDKAGIRDLHWGWPGAAATEDCPVRGGVVEGTVHDLNCAALGGRSTHAGLFGPARAVAAYADRLLHATLDPAAHRALPGRTLARLWRLRGPGSHRGGWDSVTPGASSTGRFFPPDSVGHLGYTGTSVWIAPSRRTVVVLLTNRVHPNDDKGPIREIRPRVHDAVARALGWAE